MKRFPTICALALSLYGATAVADPSVAWLDSNAGAIRRTHSSGTLDVETGLLNSTGLASNGSCILYFVSGTTLYKRELASDSKVAVATVPNIRARDLAVSNRAFLTTQQSIKAITLEGGAQTTVSFPSIASPLGIAVSETLGKVYWVDSGHLTNHVNSLNAIRRMNFDGSSRETILSSTAARAIAIDDDSGTLYWVENAPATIIRKALLDGSSPGTVTAPGLGFVTHLAFGEGYLYALEADSELKKIHPSNGTVVSVQSSVALGAGLVVLPDQDEDGTSDCDDLCPEDRGKNTPGVCGCAIADSDTDADGTLDCADQCPADSEKILPGSCGCGVADLDSDADGTLDCSDQCPLDAAKLLPGQCGCGLFEAVNGNQTQCARIPPIVPTLTPSPTVVRTGSQCAATLTLQRFPAVGGRVRYTVVIVPRDRRLRTKTFVTTNYRERVRLSRSGRYLVRYRAEIVSNNRIIRRTRTSSLASFSLSTRQCQNN